jgi:hypothetical protein
LQATRKKETNQCRNNNAECRDRKIKSVWIIIIIIENTKLIISEKSALKVFISAFGHFISAIYYFMADVKQY